MMDVRLSLGTRVTASPANARIARENDVSDLAPLKGLRLSRRKRHQSCLGIQAARGADHGWNEVRGDDGRHQRSPRGHWSTKHRRRNCQRCFAL